MHITYACHIICMSHACLHMEDRIPVKVCLRWAEGPLNFVAPRHKAMRYPARSRWFLRMKFSNLVLLGCSLSLWSFRSGTLAKESCLKMWGPHLCRNIQCCIMRWFPGSMRWFAISLPLRMTSLYVFSNSLLSLYSFFAFATPKEKSEVEVCWKLWLWFFGERLWFYVVLVLCLLGHLRVALWSIGTFLESGKGLPFGWLGLLGLAEAASKVAHKTGHDFFHP